MAKKKISKKTAKELPKSYERLQEFAHKARVEVERILKIVGKEADLSSQLLKRKVDIYGLDSKVEKKYIDLGKEAYNLVDKGKITHAKLKGIVRDIDNLYDLIDKSKEEVDKLKKQIKDAVAS